MSSQWRMPPLRHFLSEGHRPWWWVVLLGAVLFLPRLGSEGLWDPWEPHYAEVAREMVESRNWLQPTWELSAGQPADRKYFFSKPPLSMWLMALGMSIVGCGDAEHGIKPGLEWVIRLPFALLAIFGMLVVFALGRYFFDAETGFLAALILGTSPMYFFIARQAMTDMPLVALGFGGTALLVLGSFAEDERPVLIYAGYALLGLSVLAKGLGAVALCGIAFLVFFVFTGNWKLLGRLRPIGGAAIFLLVAAPWFIYLSLASWLRNLLDDEGKTFFQRFFLHDHLYRIGSGVHGDRGNFAYFIEQLGLGAHPWAPLMAWATCDGALGLDTRPESGPRRVELFLWIYVVGGFALFAFSMTKFHHYILPVLPALALLAARFLVGCARGEKNLPLPVMLLLVLGVVMISRDIGLMPKGLVDLFVYNYSRPFPEKEAVPGQVGFSLIYGLTALGMIFLFFSGRMVFCRWISRALGLGAFIGALWGGIFFMNSMAPHWSQRRLFDTYYARRSPADPIGAYLMNWRGETFYSLNTVTQLRSADMLRRWLDDHSEKKRFLLVEQHRLAKLKEMLSPLELQNLQILDRSCNKFFLVSLEPGKS
jgi:4-amino-4-deoxy-L-arabinose transferase-like glycosyltransferase